MPPPERTQRAPSQPLPARAADCHMHVLGPFERHAGDTGEWLANFAGLAAPFGWHLQLFCGADLLVEMESVLAKSKSRIVIDHMGLPDAAAGIEQPGFQTVLRLLRSPNIWVKLAGADRITRRTGKLRDAVPFIQALAAGELLDILSEAVPDAATRHAILADNPEHLYGFGS